MNLRIFFDNIKEPFEKPSVDPTLFVNNIKVHSEDFPDWKEADIALIGLVEDRGSMSNNNLENGPDEIRKKLYNLKRGGGAYKIVDLGNLRCGVNLEESYLRVKEVCEMLMQHNTIPVLFGGTHDLDFGQFLGYESSGKVINMLNVDAFVDMTANREDMSRHHIHKILVNDPNIIFHYSQLAHQSYLVDPETINVLEKLYFETRRLGQLRESLEDIEPVVRNADMLSFDITAIKQADAPGNANAQPFGLTGEEACQICWYAGLSSRLSSFGIYEYNPELDFRGQTAGVIATMVWYFIEGFYLRQEDKDLGSANFTKYIVSLQEEPHKLVFYKNEKSEKWWLEVPYPEGKSKFARNSIVPCSYADYQDANNGEIPNRWLLTHAKLI
ncbi:formimidoylglutamase [Sporocytophaga myxococcoides]|uniref:formimidoylglutamase n=1 Tax=Sporocytophaga myxococcoides TaxID=153721 RepID=UPI000408934B|nr:formimidoylglutamase [Sporocytophaga myxococcoides]